MEKLNRKKNETKKKERWTDLNVAWEKKKCKYHQLVSKNHQAREFRFTFLFLFQNKRLSKQFVKDHQFSTQTPKQTEKKVEPNQK